MMLPRHGDRPLGDTEGGGCVQPEVQIAPLARAARRTFCMAYWPAVMAANVYKCAVFQSSSAASLLCGIRVDYVAPCGPPDVSISVYPPIR
jgi:hypothetical protein